MTRNQYAQLAKAKRRKRRREQERQCPNPEAILAELAAMSQPEKPKRRYPKAIAKLGQRVEATLSEMRYHETHHVHQSEAMINVDAPASLF
mgnify:FL=1